MFKKQSLYDTKYLFAIENGYECWGGNDRFSKKLNQVENLLNSNLIPCSGKVLELGCGEGVLCREFYKNGYSVTGVDISKIAIDWANKKNDLSGMKIKYIHSDISMPDISLNDLFDLIIDGNCFHCIIGTERQNFLNNVYHMLSSSGILFINSLLSPDTVNHTIIADGVHYRFIPTEEFLITEIKNSGFNIINKVVHQRDKFNHIELFCKR